MQRKPSFSKIVPEPESHEATPGEDPPPPLGEDPAAKIKRIQLLVQSLWQKDEEATFEHVDSVFISVAWSPDGKKVATASLDATCCIFDVESQRQDAKFEHGRWVKSVAWSPDGKKVATASLDATCRIFDVESQRQDAKFEHGDWVFSVAWSPDEKKVATASEDKTCRIFDVESQRQDANFEHGDGVNSVAWSPDGKKVATASCDKTCRIFDVESQRQDAKFEHGDRVFSVAWSRDGKKVATASLDATCGIFDVESQRQDAKFEHGAMVNSVAWSPDGKKVATASDDKTCCIFDVESQRQNTKFEHGARVFSVAWSRDGKKVATASFDKTCRIFDVESQRQDAKFEHGARVNSVAWSPDGKKVATASDDKTCRIWSSWDQSLCYTSNFWRSIDWQSIGSLDQILFTGRLNVTLFGLLCYCWFFHLKGWKAPMPLEEKELQELVEGKRQRPGDRWDLVFRVDAEGISPMSLAVESGNAQWMAAYVNKETLSYLSSCDKDQQNLLNYQTRCKYLITASSAIARLLSSQELGSLSDPLSDLLKLFILPAEKNPYKSYGSSNGQPVRSGNAAIQLHPLVSENMWWPQDFDESRLPTKAGYKIELTAHVFVMPQILSSDFLSQLSEKDIPDAVAVFSCSPIMAAIALKWQRWKRYYYFECIVYSIFQGLYMWVTVQGIDGLSPCIHVDANETDVGSEDAGDEADTSCFPAQVWGLKLTVTALALLIILRECKELYAVAFEEYHGTERLLSAAKRFLQSLFFSWSFTATTMPILVIVNLWFEELLQLQPIVACWSWLYFLYFLGGMDTTAAYVGMLWEVVKDMRSFSVVLLVVILGLGHAFSLAAQNRDTWNQIQRVYRMGIMGDFEVDDYNVDGSDLEQHHVLYLFFILITVAITVSMLNLLIAVISDTYARVNENMVSRLNRARAARIAELERAYGKLHMCGFLMFLQPAQGSDKLDWQGAVATIPKRTHQILQGELNHVKGELKEVKGELKEVKGELKEELKDVKDAQGKLEGELKEIRKFLEDFSDKFNANIGSSGFRRNEAPAEEEMVEDAILE